MLGVAVEMASPALGVVMAVAVQSIQCASCGAGINVPPDLDRLSCGHCGTPLAIVRGEGYVAAKLAERVSATIAASGAATVDELRQLQRRQEATALEAQIAALAAEARELRRGPSSGLTHGQIQRVEGEHDHTVRRLWGAQDALGIARTHQLFRTPQVVLDEHPELVPVKPIPVLALVLFVAAVLILMLFYLASR
jgi:ribosomal protein S27AE